MSPSGEKIQKIRVGVAGAGHMGQYHINLLTKILDSKDIFIYDINLERCRELAQIHGVNVCETYEELLKEVEAVVIVVPTYLHYEYSMKAMKAGCHVLVEKPISNNLEHAREMVFYAEDNNLVLHIGHVERFNGAVQAVRDQLEKPYYFQAQRVSSVSRIQDVGVVLDLMIHDIDIILSLVDSPVKQISAYGRSVITNFEDYALAVLYFENGVVATITASRVSSYKARTMVVSQQDSYISLDYATNDLVLYKTQNVQYNVSQDQITYKEETVMDRVVVHRDNPLKVELEYFLDEICGDSDDKKYSNLIWDSHSNFYTMEIAFRILEQINATIHKKSNS